jgi:hypothetical protein
MIAGGFRHITEFGFRSSRGGQDLDRRDALPMPFLRDRYKHEASIYHVQQLPRYNLKGILLQAFNREVVLLLRFVQG